MCFRLSITKTLHFNAIYMLTNVILRHSGARNGLTLYFGAEDNTLTPCPLLRTGLALGDGGHPRYGVADLLAKNVH